MKNELESTKSCSMELTKMNQKIIQHFENLEEKVMKEMSTLKTQAEKLGQSCFSSLEIRKSWNDQMEESIQRVRLFFFF